MPETNPPQPDVEVGRRETGPLQAQVQNVMNRCITPALGQVTGQAEAAIQDASEEMRQHAKRLAEAVQDQPLTSIGLAALVGFVVARLMGR
ncbi:MAG: hypothetical protein WCP77_13705, partial [Roseococcus sp.]